MLKIYVLLLLFFNPVISHAAAISHANECFSSFTGKIDNKYPIHFSLIVSSAGFSGNYYYEKYKKLIPLKEVEDKYSNDYDFILREDAGYFELTLDKNKIIGSWFSDDGVRKFPVELTPISSYSTHQQSGGITYSIEDIYSDGHFIKKIHLFNGTMDVFSWEKEDCLNFLGFMGPREALFNINLVPGSQNVYKVTWFYDFAAPGTPSDSDSALISTKGIPLPKPQFSGFGNFVTGCCSGSSETLEYTFQEDSVTAIQRSSESSGDKESYSVKVIQQNTTYQETGNATYKMIKQCLYYTSSEGKGMKAASENLGESVVTIKKHYPDKNSCSLEGFNVEYFQ